MKVFVYFNLRSKLWSVKALQGTSKGRVIAHSSTVHLTDCAFKVSQAGRERVLKEKQKNVHAGVVGYLTDVKLRKCHRAVSYNPYKGPDFFHRDTLTPVTSAPRAVLKNRQVFIPA